MQTYLSHLMAVFSKLVSVENYMCMYEYIPCLVHVQVYSGHSDPEILAKHAPIV